jgi:uncharacterized membrane protein
MTEPTIQGAYGFGWRAFKARWPFWIGLMAIMFAVNIGVQLIAGLFESVFANVPTMLAASGLVMAIASLVIQTQLTIGTIVILLGTVDDQTVGYGHLLAETRLLGRFFVANLLFSLAVAVGFLLLVIPALYVIARFGLFGLALVDGKLGILESFRRSSDLTEGHRWTLLGIVVIGFVLLILGAIPFGLGVLVAAPVVGLAGAYFYRELSPMTASVAPAPGAFGLAGR